MTRCPFSIRSLMLLFAFFYLPFFCFLFKYIIEANSSWPSVGRRKMFTFLQCFHLSLQLLPGGVCMCIFFCRYELFFLSRDHKFF